ncbi:hypothetical protein QLQ12_08845 [Actinoplanes sp. NEAU-A12]|uniref:Leucine rich repeat variant n=1 Tax=Actinoplanes sandaracinus TaxID=3045177 RepID=A0ABT6WG60_9ACTN|nr:hypothetical protein [Actinoplanes sandaracinus]MDI6098706.1 hypothetical protein [Actinoplanes sandaracinus]
MIHLQLLADDDPKVRLSALGSWRRSLPTHLADALRVDPDPQVARLMAERMNPLAPTPLADLVNDASPQIRLAAAQHPDLPPLLVAVLATDTDPGVRLAVSMRPELTEEQRAAIDYEVRPEDRLVMPDAIRDRLDDIALVRRMARSSHTGLRRFAACSPHLPPDLVEVLADDPDFAVRLLLCENQPTVSDELLLRTYLEAKVVTSSFLPMHPNFPRSKLSAGATSDRPELRSLALLDPATTAEQAERLSHDPDPHVRALAARDQRLTPNRVHELLTDPHTAPWAASNPVLSIPHMLELLTQAGIAWPGSTQRRTPGRARRGACR